MNPFTKIVPTDKAELKAVWFALLTCGLFIILFSVLNPPPRRTRKASSHDLAMPAPMNPSKLLESERLPVKDSNERFRRIPENFKNFDFRNRSYGLYTFPDGKTIDLTLSVSELSIPNSSGWFSLKDVYYKDVTGDAQAEAIVRLSHVTCGGSCDGGADLFYIYGMRNGKLTTLWHYETGSRAYGCSLKSLTVGKQLMLELFGRCPKPATDDPGPAKFVVQNLTLILFNFDGRRFRQEAIEVFSMPSTNVKNHESAIRLF